MELIDSEPRARRLARAVAGDIVIYNEKQISAGADLSREIAEGRSHFRARVTPSLHWVFEEVVAGTALGKAGKPSEKPAAIAPSVTTAAKAPASPPPVAKVAAKAPASPPPVEKIATKAPASPPPVAKVAAKAPASPPPIPPRPVPKAEVAKVVARLEQPRLEQPRAVAPEAPRLPSSAPPVEAGVAGPEPEPEREPRAPQSARAPLPAPVELRAEQPPAMIQSRSNRWIVVALVLCALGVAIALGWFVRR